MNSKAGSRYGDPWSFPGRADYLIFDNVNPLWINNVNEKAKNDTWSCNLHGDKILYYWEVLVETLE